MKQHYLKWENFVLGNSNDSNYEKHEYNLERDERGKNNLKEEKINRVE